jgi:2-haloacid dehalogenase
VRLVDFDALSFDCYGTLIDWESGISAVLSPWAAAHGVTRGEQLLEQFGVAEAEEESRAPTALYPDILAATIRNVGRRLGAGVDSEEAARLGRSAPDWPAFPDAPAALATLARKYKLIILSNIDRQSFAASNARLGVRFDAVITAQDVGSYKPAAHNFEVLLETVRAMNIEPERLLHVAQSLFHDHVPAQSIGLSTAWIDRRRGRSGWGATCPPAVGVRPDWTFASMADFAAACMASGEG